MYTWGYVKELSLMKLDMSENEAEQLNLLRKFPYYANEVITQISSAIKPKYTYFTIRIYENKEDAKSDVNRKYDVDLDKVYYLIEHPDKWHGHHGHHGHQYIITDKIHEYIPTEREKVAMEEYESIVKSGHFANVSIKMPDDFISFGNAVNTMFVCGELSKAHNTDFMYHGYNEIIFKHHGTFSISYNARWYTFGGVIDNKEVLDIPEDILDCIPSYIAHQCYKIDDEVKASIFRNEYELALARIDPADPNTGTGIVIDGGW